MSTDLANRVEAFLNELAAFVRLADGFHACAAAGVPSGAAAEAVAADGGRLEAIAARLAGELEAAAKNVADPRPVLLLAQRIRGGVPVADIRAAAEPALLELRTAALATGGGKRGRRRDDWGGVEVDLLFDDWTTMGPKLSRAEHARKWKLVKRHGDATIEDTHRAACDAGRKRLERLNRPRPN